MAHYSIYIPRACGASPELLPSVGLAELQRRQQWDFYDVARGPDGSHGVIATVFSHRDDSNPSIGYLPHQQQWTESAANPGQELPKGAFWFGVETDRPPRPIDLSHQTLMNGYDVRLKDGNAWRIPETLQMPMDIGRDPNTGELTKLYPGEYHAFCKQAEKYVIVLFDNILNLEILKKSNPAAAPAEVSSEFVLEDIWEFCCTALSLNYRLADPILGHGFMDLLDERKMALIVRATIALPDILEVIEKKS